MNARKDTAARRRIDLGHHDAPLVVAAIAACVAAATTGVAAVSAGSADEGWQSALRQEVQRAASVTEVAQYVYPTQGLFLFSLEATDVRADELTRVASTAGLARELIEAEARAEQEAAFALRHELLEAAVETPELWSPDEIDGLRADDGVIDLGLAYVRDRDARAPTAVLPEASQAAGDAAARRVRWFVTATYLVGAAFAVGWIAFAWSGRARLALTRIAVTLLALVAPLALAGVLA